MKSNNRNNIFLIHFIALLMLMVYCRNHGEKTPSKLPVIEIEKNINSFEYVNLSEIADDIEYIPLETDINSMISYIHKLLVTKDSYIVVERFSCKAFDKFGNFICSYGSQGKGPGQFTYFISNVSVDLKNKRLYLSSPPHLFMEYSDDGNFIRNIEVPPEIIDSINQSSNCITSGDYIFYGFTSINHIKLFAFNDRKVVLATYPDYYDDPSLQRNMLAYLGANSSILALSNNILYKDGLCDTAFYLTADLHREPAYYFHFGEYSHLMKYLKSISDHDNIEELKGSFNHLQITDLKEINDLLLFTCSFGNYLPKSEFLQVNEQQYTVGPFHLKFLGFGNPVRAIFNRQTSELVFLKKPAEYLEDQGGFSGFINDIDGGVPFWPLAQPYGKHLACTVNAYDLKAYIAGETFKNSKPKYPEKKNALKRFADSLNYDDNPVLMIVTVKE